MSVLTKNQDVFELGEIGEFFVKNKLPKGHYTLDVSDTGSVKLSKVKKFFINKEDLDEIRQK